MVCFDSIIFSLQRQGGISKYWANLLSYMSNSDMDFLSLNYQKSERNIFFNSLSKTSQFSIFKGKCYRYLPLNAPACEVFHSSYLRNPLSNNCGVIHTIHDFMYDFYESRFFPKKVHQVQRNVAVSRSNHIICVSEQTKSDFFKFYPEYPIDQISVIYNGVGSEFYEINKESDCLIPLKEELGDFVLYVGSRGYCKNFDAVIKICASDAFRDLNLNLVVVSSPFSDYEMSLIPPNVRSRLHVFSFISDQKLNYLYNLARCMIMPSIYEGFGIPAAEAARSGCLVLANDLPIFQEVLSDGLFDLLNLDDNKDFLSILEDVKKCDSIRINQFERSLSFDWKDNFENHLNIYQRFL